MLNNYEIAVTTLVKKPLHVALYRMTYTCNHIERKKIYNKRNFILCKEHRTKAYSGNTKRKYKICVRYLQTKQNRSTHRKNLNERNVQ